MDTGEIITLALSLISALGVGTILPMLVKTKIEEKKRKEEETSEKAKQQRLEALREIVKEELKPVQENISKLVADSELTKKGLQATLRHDLYEIAHKARKDGYCPDETKYDFNNMYEQYHKLGNNGVMDGIKDEILAMPTEPTKKDKLCE